VQKNPKHTAVVAASEKEFGWEAGIRTPIGGFRVRRSLILSVPLRYDECAFFRNFAHSTIFGAADYGGVWMSWHTTGTQ
jgi:hypothetical protein